MENICNSCPRKCATNRLKTTGFCGATNKIQINKAMLHFWEEPIISGDETTKKRGSGAIFFSHCNLGCVYCQNYDISHGDFGEFVTPEQLVQIFKDFENQNATNINLVTPTHYAFQILDALKIYKPKIPVVWNTGGYENPEVVKQLEGFVDIFLTDFKYHDDELAKKYSFAPNYLQNCIQSLKVMKQICPQNIVVDGLMQKGIVVRHLVLPSHTNDTKQVLCDIKSVLGTDAIVSLLSQYVPVGKASNFPEINRKLKPIEYKVAKAWMYKLGLDGFVQEMDSATTDFIPDFNTQK